MIAEFQGKYRPLSNFWYKDVYLPDDRLIYPTNEHAYQAAKTYDLNIRNTIRLSESPRDAKALGRNIDLRANWNKDRRIIMLHLTRVKYAYSDMEELLLSTGTQKLVEGNDWHDNYWGVCSCMACNHERKTDVTFGRNWLGKILMLVRLELQIKKGID